MEVSVSVDAVNFWVGIDKAIYLIRTIDCLFHTGLMRCDKRGAYVRSETKTWHNKSLVEKYNQVFGSVKRICTSIMFEILKFTIRQTCRGLFSWDSKSRLILWCEWRVLWWQEIWAYQMRRSSRIVSKLLASLSVFELVPPWEGLALVPEILGSWLVMFGGD